MGAEARLPIQLGANRRIVICGSMTFFGYMSRIREQLLRNGVEAIIPDAEDHLTGALPPNELEEFRRSMALAHIRRVRNPRTFGVLAVNFDKYGLEDYIGPSTFAEIAIAAAHGKRIFI